MPLRYTTFALALLRAKKSLNMRIISDGLKNSIGAMLLLLLFVGVGILSMIYLILSDYNPLTIAFETDSMLNLAVLREITTTTASATWNEIVYKSLFLVI